MTTTSTTTIRVTIGAVDVIANEDWSLEATNGDEQRAAALRAKAEAAYRGLAVAQIGENLTDCYPDVRVEIAVPPQSVAPDRTLIDIDREYVDADQFDYGVEGEVQRAEEEAYECLFEDAISDIVWDAQHEETR